MTTELDELKTRLERAERRVLAADRRLEASGRRARLTGGLALAALGLSLLLDVRPAARAQPPGAGLTALIARIGVLEQKTAPLSLQTDPGRADRRGNTELYLTGVNVHVVSGSGSTSDGTADVVGRPTGKGHLTGLGNLIVGYNTPRTAISGTDVRAGSHNLIVGDLHRYASFGGVVFGLSNTGSGPYAAVTGGNQNVASGDYAAVTGGAVNTASGACSSVTGGEHNTAHDTSSSVSGGFQLTEGRVYGWMAGTLHSP